MESLKRYFSGLRKTGVRLSSVNRVFFFFAVVCSALLLVVTYRSSVSYSVMRQATDRYIACQEDAVLLEEGSDHLTSEARSYVATGIKQHALNYVDILNDPLRQEIGQGYRAIFAQEKEALFELEQALDRSNKLARLECSMMRLAAEGYGEDLAAYPVLIAQAPLTEEEEALSPQEKLDHALDRLFDDAYFAKKAMIYEHVQRSIHGLMEKTQRTMMDASSGLDLLMRLQAGLILALAAELLLSVALTSRHIVRPMRRNITLVDRREPMPEKGVYEIRHLARVYNEILSKTNQKQEMLSFSASHDALTGLFNRAAFEDASRQYMDSDVCVLVVDVDNFKRFNDSFGHDMGDRVLQRVARELRAAFRSDDHISRIGGDEFCVIMKSADSSMSGLVQAKVSMMNRRLSQPDQETPGISLSVGAAFHDRKHPVGTIFKDADVALYRVKRNGRIGCMIY